MATALYSWTVNNTVNTYDQPWWFSHPFLEKAEPTKGVVKRQNNVGGADSADMDTTPAPPYRTWRPLSNHTNFPEPASMTAT